MFKRSTIMIFLMAVLVITSIVIAQDSDDSAVDDSPQLLSDPMLQLPTTDGVHVVWFTEWEGQEHFVSINDRTVTAESMLMSRTAEDARSWVGEQAGDGSIYEGYTRRAIWRHEAYVDGLTAGERVPYAVTSIADDGTEVVSESFSLQPLPATGQNVNILLTSDHQLKPMTTANLQVAVDMFGSENIDAVFFAGDLENVPDRASEWFDDSRGFAFFAGLQGNGNYTLNSTRIDGNVTYDISQVYQGGEIIQYAPMFPVVGNHEVMGRYNPGNDLNSQFNDPQPRFAAEARYEQLAAIINPDNDPAIREQWIEDNSFNVVTYSELFTLPDDSPGGESYYALAYGDVYVISLYSTRIWRTPSMGDTARGKYREPESALNTPDNWGYGDFIFEDLAVDSEQYNWLVQQLQSEAYQNARYQVVIMHQGPHGLGENVNPTFAHPVQVIDYDEAGRIEAVRYEYPIEEDILYRDVEPLFDEYGVDLVHTGHSHLWWHMESDAGVDYIETANVGNNYGCYLEGYRERGNVPNDDRFEAANYPTVGDPHGLAPIFPSLFSPQQDNNGEDLPCIASNDMTIFSMFNTETGMISSYIYDTRQPDSDPVLFDEFAIGDE